MEDLGQMPRGSTVGAVPVQTSYWMISDFARPRSETGDLIIVDERWRSAAVPLRIRCASDPPARARALSVLPVNDRSRAFSDGVLLISRHQRSKQSFAVRTTSGPLRGYWDKPETETRQNPAKGFAGAAEQQGLVGKGPVSESEAGGNGAEFAQHGRWPGLVNITPPGPIYELGRDKKAVKALKRKRAGDAIRKEELRPLPGRFHVAMSPNAMRGKLKAPRRAALYVHPRSPTVGALQQELQEVANKDPTSFEAYVIKALWPDKVAQLQTFPGVELERFDVDDIGPTGSLFPAGKKLRANESGYVGGLENVGGSPGLGLNRRDEPGVREARGRVAPGLASTKHLAGGEGVEASLDEESWAGHGESFSFDEGDPFGFAPHAVTESGPTEPLTPLGLFSHEDPFRWDAHNRLGPVSPPNVEPPGRRQWEDREQDPPGRSPRERDPLGRTIRAHSPESPKLPFGFSVSQHLLGDRDGPSPGGSYVPGLRDPGRKGGARVAATWLETTSTRPPKLQVRGSKGQTGESPIETVQSSRPFTRAQKRRSSEEKHQSGHFVSLLGELNRGGEALIGEEDEDPLNDLAEVDTIIQEPGDSPTGAMDWVAAVSREILASSEVFFESAPAVGTQSGATDQRPVPEFRPYRELVSEVVDTCLGGGAPGPGAVATCIKKHTQLLKEVEKEYGRREADLKATHEKQDALYGVKAEARASKQSQLDGLRVCFVVIQHTVAKHLRETLEILVGVARPPEPAAERGRGKREPRDSGPLSTQHRDPAGRVLRSSQQPTGANPLLGLSRLPIDGEQPSGQEKRVSRRVTRNPLSLGADDSEGEEAGARLGGKGARRTVPGGSGRRSARAATRKRGRASSDSDYEPSAHSGSDSARDSDMRASSSSGSDDAPKKAGGRMQATRVRKPGEKGFSGARGELPQAAADGLMAWFAERWLERGAVEAPKANKQERCQLARRFEVTERQVGNWLVNARARVWKPMMKEIRQELNASPKKPDKKDPSKGKRRK
ncbi:hypothetical protein KFL_000100090 [Klebsormidium nitens]|uniref:Homeobox domain-containing protein n=1 Tax=Klebsormidium nitens TaxID=105231 RepID=A0A1Y1HKT2_KLENI|nr:hypothetical protein KFL_000100090 [Klebsormidium nitens]|eukprot:GAQ78242.1 hypothetical protein KFL_000100090 [Klebsormidium nitens]